MKLNFTEKPKKHTKLDFGRTGDRIYIDARQSVTLMGRAGGGAAKTGYYLLPVHGAYAVCNDIRQAKCKAWKWPAPPAKMGKFKSGLLRLQKV